MSKLITQLEATKDKKAYQTYTIEHGIEHIQVLVPVKQVSLFEEQFANLKSKQKTNIIDLVKQVGGKIRG